MTDGARIVPGLPKMSKSDDHATKLKLVIIHKGY